MLCVVVVAVMDGLYHLAPLTFNFASPQLVTVQGNNNNSTNCQLSFSNGFSNIFFGSGSEGMTLSGFSIVNTGAAAYSILVETSTATVNNFQINQGSSPFAIVVQSSGRLTVNNLIITNGGSVGLITVQETSYLIATGVTIIGAAGATGNALNLLAASSARFQAPVRFRTFPLDLIAMIQLFTYGL